jgi:molybdopterin/thiamine biosynthesis adenylyltransferase
MNNDAFSRPRATAEGLGELAVDRGRFIDKAVLLTGFEPVLQSPNGRTAFLASLRLLVRICRNVTVYIPRQCAGLIAEAMALLRHTALEEAVGFASISPNLDGFDAILSIGGKPEGKDLPLTSINANGWLVFVDSCGNGVPSTCSAWNPVAAVGAACLGVTEVFKRLVALVPKRGRMLNSICFSMLEYSCNNADIGPAIPSDMLLELALFGCGAIGNGVVLLLNELGAGGRIVIVDRQNYGEENLGTCCLIGPEQVGVPKVEVMAQILRSKFQVDPVHGDISSATPFIRQLSNPRGLMLNALDNIEARHEVQRFWPSLLIDGAIGDFMSQVSVHPWGPDTACLMCLFREAEQDADQIASLATGLSLGRVRVQEGFVSGADVLAAPEMMRTWLHQHVGKTICSVIQAGVAQRISRQQQRPDFEPSVPFVACFSAAMMIGELVKHRLGISVVPRPRFQMDIFRGPATGLLLPQCRRNDCICVERQDDIHAVRTSAASI